MEKQEGKGYRQAHVLLLPYPAQGHINPMLEFSKRLVAKGVKATVANSRYINKQLSMHPNNCPIGFETISDGFDEGGFAQAKSDEDYLSTFKVAGSHTLSTLMKRLQGSTHPISALIYDAFLPWALDVAKEFGVDGVAFFTQSCAVNTIYYHVQKGALSLPLSGPSTSVSLPGLPVMEVTETPSFISDYGSYPGFYHVVVNQFINIDEADWVLFNTFYNLEQEVVDWMAKKWRMGCVGPTLPSMYLDKRLEDDKNYDINLVKPNTLTCMEWLEDKPKGSVVYVSFGSMAKVEAEQMEELAWGLKASNYYVLWVVRASEEAKMPKNFTSEKCVVVNWCLQLEILAHKSIGCFVTHCGFNSVLEAISLGVPLVGMPQWTDQPTNAKYVEDIWKIGVRARANQKGVVGREVVEACIREVMESEKGVEIKENANKWKRLAREAVDEGGTSDKNINEFLDFIIGSS